MIMRSSREPKMLVGGYEIKASLDADGHLTLSVESVDGSPVNDIGDDVGLADGVFAVRLTTQEVERQYAAEPFRRPAHF